MSVLVLSWVFAHSPTKLGDRLVLLALADYAHDDGTRAFPSVESLARKARVGKSTARAALRRLEEEGHIVSEGAMPSGTISYRVLMRAPDSGGGSESSEGAPDSSRGGPDSGANPSKEPSKDPSTRGLARTREGLPPFGGKRIPGEVETAALAALAGWNERTGQANKPTKASGKLTDAMSRIVGAMLDYPEVRTLWPVMIDRAFARPWWTGEPSTGVVFGGKAVEGAIQQARVPIAASAGGLAGGTVHPIGRRPSRFETAQAGLAELHARLVAEGK